MNLGRIFMGAALMGATVWAGAALAQRGYDPNYDPNDDRNYNRSAASSSSFLQEAAMGGRAEVSMGLLARRRAQDPDVRDFADQMVQDHAMAHRQLARLAARRGWSVPGYVALTIL